MVIAFMFALIPRQRQPTCLADVELIAGQQRAQLLAVRKLLLRWASTQLRLYVDQCRAGAAPLELHPRGRLAVLLLSLLRLALIRFRLP